MLPSFGLDVHIRSYFCNFMLWQYCAVHMVCLGSGTKTTWLGLRNCQFLAKKIFWCNKHSRWCRDLDKKPVFCPKVSLKDLGGFTLRDVEMQSRTGVTAWLGGADWYWSQSTISGVNAHLGRQTRQKVLLFNRSPHSALQSVSVLLLFELLGEVQRKGEKSHQGHQQRSHLYLSPIIERMWRNEPVWSDEVRASGTLLLCAETHLEQIESSSVS